jgi:Tfp pilus assembly pilus retraction ATPase PilT
VNGLARQRNAELIGHAEETIQRQDVAVVEQELRRLRNGIQEQDAAIATAIRTIHVSTPRFEDVSRLCEPGGCPFEQLLPARAGVVIGCQRGCR